MPRLFKSNNEPMDFCKTCFPKSEQQAWELYADPSVHGEGPDDRGNCFAYDTDHPPYELENHKCCFCGCVLTEADNAIRSYE